MSVLAAAHTNPPAITPITRVEGNALLFDNEVTVDDAACPATAAAIVRAASHMTFRGVDEFMARVFAACPPHAPFVYESTFMGVDGQARADPRAAVIEALATDPLRRPTLIVVRTESVDEGLDNMRVLFKAEQARFSGLGANFVSMMETREAFDARADKFTRNFYAEQALLDALVERVRAAGGRVIQGTREELLYAVRLGGLAAVERLCQTHTQPSQGAGENTSVSVVL